MRREKQSQIISDKASFVAPSKSIALKGKL